MTDQIILRRPTKVKYHESTVVLDRFPSLTSPARFARSHGFIACCMSVSKSVDMAPCHFPKCTNPNLHQSRHVDFPNIILPMDPTPEGCIPDSGLRGWCLICIKLPSNISGLLYSGNQHFRKHVAQD